ncbi:MAG: hypothetical protein ACHQ49_03705 [Elusimicrobiota bacterium]
MPARPCSRGPRSRYTVGIKNQPNPINRRSAWIALCARLALAAFAAGVTVPAAWTQTVVRAAPMPATAVPGAVGAAFSAPSLSAPSALPSMPALAAAPLAAPLSAPGAARVAAIAPAAPPAREGSAATSRSVLETGAETIAKAAANGGDAHPAIAALFGDMSHAAAADAPAAPAAASPAATPAPATIYNLDILGKLGLKEKILAGGGIQVRADGSIVPVKKPLKVKIFDNDDNVLYLATRIYLKNKITGEEAALPTAEFAQARPMIGKSGKYQDYDYFMAPDGGSFRDTSDIRNPNIFPSDVAEALKLPSAMWRGPFWFPYATALADAETAPWVGILTSRGHEPENQVKGYDVLKQNAFLKNSPRAEMNWGVDTEKVRPILPPGLKTPEKKAAFLISALDLIESIPLEKKGRRHTLEYSDDDADMITKVREILSAEAAKKRWPHVDIDLYSTGAGKEAEYVLKAIR